MPRLDFWFRLFHHAALGLASVCLLYAEAFFLPGPLLLGLYVLAGLQVLAFGADGRRWVLPGWAANLLAGAVAGGGAAWIVMELNSPDSVLSDLPLPAGLLPYVGPLLIGLLVVKLFRPRTPRDFWLLQGVGALQVALACVLATNPQSGLLFGVLLVAYLAFTLGCLALRYFQEEQGAAKSPAAGRLPFAYRMAPFCLRWTLAVAVLAVPLFLLTPRIEGPKWDSSALAVPGPHGEAGGRVGYSPSIDLNRGGAVRLGGEEVFRVVVVAAPGEAAPDLHAGQRWRGGVLDSYADGRWSNEEIKQQMDLGFRRKPPPLAPPLGPGRYRLDFTVGPHADGFFLSEPVHRGDAPDSDHPTRVDQVEGSDKLSPLVVSLRGPVLPLLSRSLYEVHYRQTVWTGDAPDRSAAENYDGFYDESLKGVTVPGLTDWTDALLKRLAADPANGLSKADITRAPPEIGSVPMQPMPTMIQTRPVTPPGSAGPPAGPLPANSFIASPPGPPPPPVLPRASWERVGRALTAYLARSGEYTYTLDLRRQDMSLDPVMDFLVKVKAGHCERFASALALMLRSEGIPSRVVVGFRDAGERSADGAYVIRQNQAHAWVEMLVPVRTPADAPKEPSRPPRCEWVTLDPTPASDLPPPSPYTLWDWWQDGQKTGEELWGGLVVNYGADQQADLWAGLQSPRMLSALTAIGLGLPALAAVGGLTYIGLRRRRRTRGAGTKRASPAAAGYARLLALLARHDGPRPGTGQTPREFAADARRFLLGRPAAAAFADLPGDMVDRLYRVRFGGQPPAVGEEGAAEARLDELAAALRSGERRGVSPPVQAQPAG